MANPRQRRKQRSKTHKAVSHSLHAKKMLRKMGPIRGPQVLQEAWDKHKTVRQNYAALGLVHTLNPLQSGGQEIVEPATAAEAQGDDMEDVQEFVPSTSSLKSPGPSSSSRSKSKAPVAPLSAPLPKGHGRIIRDASGAVIRIELPQDDEADLVKEQAIPRTQKDMEQLEPEVPTEVLSNWVTDIGGGVGHANTGLKRQGHAAVNRTVVQALERISAPSTSSGSNTLSYGGNSKHTMQLSSTGAGPRHASSGEALYLERLVNKWGKDVDAMARDRKLNPEQRTVGQLSRGLKRTGLA